MKFGGTSVADAERLRRVAEIVAGRRAESPVVVTSALAGVTDALERLLQLAWAGERDPLERELAGLAARHREVAAAFDGDEVFRRVEEGLRDLRVLLRGLRLVQVPSPRARDAVLGCGEPLAQELLAAAIGAQGIDARVVDARAVMVTDDRFGAARPAHDLVRGRCHEQLLPLVEAGQVPVLGGYVGSTSEGVPTTLGRGGSDLSASVLGLALGARRVEIWTDVDGLLSADPRVVPAAALIEHASFHEAAELGGLGAKVLHPASIDPAIQGGIPVVVRNAARPEVSGTRIDRQPPAGAGVVRAVVSHARLARLTLRAPGRLRQAGAAGVIFDGLERAGVAPLQVTTGPLGLEAVLAQGEALAAAVDWLGDHGEVAVEEGLGLVALVGERVADDAGAWRCLLELAAPLAAVRWVRAPLGSSIGIVVPEGELPRLVRALHHRLIEQPVAATGETG